MCFRKDDSLSELRPFYTKEQVTEDLSVANACPVLYRFMEDRYIDEFLETGKLKISTIPICRHLEDKQRRDDYEAVYRYELKWVDCAEYLDARVGDNAFVLCCSLTQKAVHDKDVFSCLELHCWKELAIEIGVELRKQGFPIAEIFAGPCNYAEKERCIDMRPLKASDLRMENGIIDAQRILGRIGYEPFYTTKNFRFIHEHEYRIIWLSANATSNEPIFVTIQNPGRFACKVRAL